MSVLVKVISLVPPLEQTTSFICSQTASKLFETHIIQIFYSNILKFSKIFIPSIEMAAVEVVPVVVNIAANAIPRRGLTPQQIENLPTMLITPELAGENSSCCAVCLDNFMVDNVEKQLPCSVSTFNLYQKFIKQFYPLL